MQRKDFLKLMGAGAGMATLPAILPGCSSKKNTKAPYPDHPFSRPLSFPEEIKANKFDLVAETTRRKLVGEVNSDVYTMNDLLPSPIIRAKRGDMLTINFQIMQQSFAVAASAEWKIPTILACTYTFGHYPL
jgi:FtsP/CotA-like multicopper oxidase with cupredoxin domain